MSLLLMFSGEESVNEYNPLFASLSAISTEPSGTGLFFRIDDIDRNDKVRFVDGFDVTYNIHGRATARFKTIDAHDDPSLAYRPQNGETIQITTLEGELLFTGTITRTEEYPLEEPNFGTGLAIDCIDHSEALDHTFINATLGSDNISIEYVTPSGGVGIVQTLAEHHLVTGQTVTLEGITGSTPTINGTYDAIVTGPKTFTIPIAFTGLGVGGTARTRVSVRQAFQYIGQKLAPHGIFIDPTMAAGPLLEKIVIDGSVRQAIEIVLRAASTINGWVYRLLPSKMLQAFEAGTKDADFTLTKDNLLGGLRQETSRHGYANTIEITYGSGSKTKDEVFASGGAYNVLRYRYRAEDDKSGPEVAGPGVVINLNTGEQYYVGTYAQNLIPNSAPTTYPAGVDADAIGSGSATYRYSVAAFNAYGIGPRSPEVAVGSAPNVLNSTNYIKVDWYPVEGATGYIVYGRDGGPNGWLDILTHGETRYNDTGDDSQKTSPPVITPPSGASAFWFYRASDNALIAQGVTPNFPFIFRATVPFPQRTTVQDVGVTVPWVKRVQASHIDDYDAAVQYAKGVLNESKYLPRKVTGVTLEALAFPGTTISVVHPDRNMVGGEWLITSVNFVEREDASMLFRYSLSEDNKRKPGWLDIWKEIAGSSATASPSVMSGGGGGGGGEGLTGSGTGQHIARWSGPDSLADSTMIESDGNFTIPGALTVSGNLAAGIVSTGILKGVTDGTYDLQVRNNNSTNVIQVTSATPTVVEVPGTLRTPAINAASNLTIAPAGDVIFNPTGQQVSPIAGYAVDLGEYDKKYRALWASELWVETLVAQETITTIGGNVLVGTSNVLVSDITTTSETIVVKYNNLFNGDQIVFKSFGKVEHMSVTSSASGVAGQWTYSVVRNLDGSGANSWAAGDAIVNTGQTGSGFIEIYAIEGIKSTAHRGPTVVGNIRNSATFNDWSPRWAIGNLNGLYGYTSTAFGAAFGRHGQQWITIDDVNGIRMHQPAGPVLHIHPNGNAYFFGIITAIGGSNVALNDLSNVTTIDGGKIATNSIKSNSIDTNSLGATTITLNGAGRIISNGMGWGSGGPGVYLGWNGSAWAFGVGNWSGRRMYWDGSSLVVVSNYVSFGTIVMDGNGIQIPQGTNTGGSRITFNGIPVYSSGSGILYVDGGLDCLGNFYSGGTAEVDGLAVTDAANFYAGVWLNNSNVHWNGPPDTTSDDYILVWSPNNGNIYTKDNGLNGNYAVGGNTLNLHRGLIVGIS